MESADVIVIGAGASGLMAAYELVKAGTKVIVIEARDRLGGRIHTINNQLTGDVIEAGAEFIHGNLSLTFRMLEEAGIKRYATGGRTWLYKNGELKQGEDLIENWHVLMSRIGRIKDDLPLSTFLEQQLSEPEYEDLRRSVRSFVEGYDAADTTKTSTLAMKSEWENEDQWDQYRSEGGYGKLVSYLEKKCREGGASFYLSAVVKQVKWQKNNTEVITADGRRLKASKAVISVPLGILQAEGSADAAITFSPEIPDKIKAARAIGYGAVIKLLLEFDHPFWNEVSDKNGNKMKEMGYLFTEAFIPTWWTQFPKPSSYLTGWLAGPKAAALKDADEKTIVEQALQVLAEIFTLEKKQLRNQLRSSQIFNWTADPFTLGAYAYNSINSGEAKKILKQPVEDTLYFTGEALGKDNESGTVEIALAAGEAVAREILKE